jgi:DNA-directed RNA polymerase specialized sigma24 family protein
LEALPAATGLSARQQIPQGTVKSRLHTARRKLADLLGETS